MTEDPVLILLTITYYVVLPLVFIYPIIVIIKKKNYLKGTVFFSKGREDSSKPIIKKSFFSIQRFKIFFVIYILIFIPLTHLNSTELMDRHIQIDRSPAPGPGEGVIYNPVPNWGKIGPYFDTNEVLREMRREPERWHLENITDELDFDEISRIPGRLTAYYQQKVYWDYIILTYSYLSPLPITRVYGFRIIEDEAFLRYEDTIVYPMSPDQADPF